MSIKQYLHHLNRRDTKILTKPKISRLSKFCLVFLVLISSIYLVKVIKAQNIIEQVQNAQAKGNNAESWHLNALGATSVTMVTSIAGKMEFNPDGSLKTTYVPGGVIGLTNNFIAALYVPPASGIQYIAEMKNNFLGINKPAYAQGAGFIGLQPLLPLWRGFRNTTYILSAVVFVIIGLLIMFRIKISPQATITIQNAIPQIITSLILVTFSYAIAGLLIDISQLFQALVLFILFNNFQQASVFSSGINNLLQPGLGTTFGLMFKLVPGGALWMLSTIPGGIIGGIMGTFFGGPPTALAGLVLGAVLGGVIVLLILLILIVIWLIQFLFGIIKVYVNIILKIILAPLEIAMGAFPNSKMGFSSWIFDLIANLAVFPISIIFLVFANIIMELSKGPLWQPSIISGGAINTPMNASGGLVPVAIGITSLMLLSKLPELIPQLVFQLKPSGWGTALGQAYKETTQSAGMKLGKQYGLERGAQVVENRYKGATEGEGGPNAASWGQKVGMAVVRAARGTGALNNK